MFAPLIALALIVPSYQQPSDAQVTAWIAGDLHDGAAYSPTGERLSAAGLGDDLLLARQVDGRLSGAGAHGLVVGVHRGEVTLHGQVADEAQRKRTLALVAEVDGVRAVDDRLLLPGQKSAPAPVAAAEPAPVSARSEAFDFLTEDGRAGRGVVVAVDQGVATLTGAACSVEAQRHATVVAQRVPGVRAVRNEMSVRTFNPADDRRLGLLVQRQMDNDVIVQTVSNALLVTVENGVARITGCVRDAGQREQATRVAAGIGAVFAVDNRLTVNENLVLPPIGRIAGFRDFRDHW